MTLILDEQTEQRLRRELARGVFAEPAALIAHALELVEQEEDWLLSHRDQIRRGIEESLAAKRRGDFFSAEDVQRHVATRRAVRSAA